MDNKYITTQDLFNAVVEKLKTKGQWPKNLDYALLNYENDIELKETELNPFFKIYHGSNEGIYLDLFIDLEDQRYISDNEHVYYLGCIKTLEEDEEAFRQYAVLGANYQLAVYEFVREHYDELKRTGFTTVFYAKDGMRRLLQTKRQMTVDYPAWEYETQMAIMYRTGFIEIHESDENGWDYTLYDSGCEEQDGGVMDMDVSENILNVLKEVLDMFYADADMFTEPIYLLDYDLFMEVEDAVPVPQCYLSDTSFKVFDNVKDRYDYTNYHCCAFEVIDNDSKRTIKSNKREGFCSVCSTLSFIDEAEGCSISNEEEITNAIETIATERGCYLPDKIGITIVNGGSFNGKSALAFTIDENNVMYHLLGVIKDGIVSILDELGNVICV